MRMTEPEGGNPYAGRPAESPIRLNGGACSHLGLRRRRNEDAFLVAVEHGVYAVADGMGGHPAGDVASRLAIEVLAKALGAGDAAAALSGSGAGDDVAAALPGPGAGTIERLHPAGSAAAALEGAYAAANAALLEHALARPDHSGLGTTLTVLLVRDGRATFGHVGDSRLYLVRSGECHQLTTDHTWVEREVREGRLTAAAARHHPHSAVLLRVLGGADARPDVGELVLEPGDRLVLCTDGVSNAIGPADLQAILLQDLPATDLARHLCDAADARGGFDNSTAVVVDAA
jgi:protein phosphatase